MHLPRINKFTLRNDWKCIFACCKFTMRIIIANLAIIILWLQITKTQV